MKRTALALTLILALLALLLVGVESVKVVKANAIPWPETPNQEKPTLTVETPQNNTVYNANGVYLNFTVTKPDSWNVSHFFWHYIGEIDSIDIYLDGNLSAHYSKYQTDVYSGKIDLTNFSAKLNQTTSGLHMLNVTVLSYTYYKWPTGNNSSIESGITSDGKPVYEYPIIVSDIVYYTVVGEPSPSPSLSSQETEPEPFPTTLVATAPLVAATVIIGFVAYRKRGIAKEKTKKIVEN